jgi:hypothetical protein
LTLNGNILYLILGLVGLLVVVGLGSLAARRRFKGLDTARFAERWRDLQKLCGKEDTWPLAVINADKLVDDALKQCHYKGKTMGARLVKAQRDLTDNDGVWFGHKLRNKLVHEDFNKLNRKMVLDALSGFRQALRDLGALK